ncbi:hypothetical protein [Inhella proteolytica]|uniref:Uncharacterized protein n=1 Tax=Inhella proteolytica TaxID=2795029 RepID=A0A931J2B7_9BURK|nr:hypothetical protein [Inhella proteolytica]MBH9576418.1 hypothetical protein [Inhella proteolytica]
MHKSTIIRISATLAIFSLHGTCAAMAPDYVGIGGLFLIAAGVIGLIFAAIGAALDYKRIRGGIIGFGVFVGIAAIVIQSLMRQSAEFHEDLKEMDAEKQAALTRSLEALNTRCLNEEKFTLVRKIDAGSKIFLDLPPGQKSPTADSTPLTPDSEKMKNQRRRFGYSFPPSSTYQYHDPIAWIETANQPKVVASLAKTDFIEYRNWGFIPQSAEYGRIERLAPKQRWLKEGLEDLAIAHSKKYPSSSGHHEEWPDEDFAFPIPVPQHKSTYIFTVEDISTMEDRSLWIARGRIRLTNAATSEILAEYIGFKSLLKSKAECPSALKDSVMYDGSWDLLKYFFSRIVEE